MWQLPREKSTALSYLCQQVVEKQPAASLFSGITGVGFPSPGEYLPCSAAPGVLGFKWGHLLFDFRFLRSEEPPRICFDPVGQWTLNLGLKICNWSQPFQATLSGADCIYSPAPLTALREMPWGCWGCTGWEQKSTPSPLQEPFRKVWHSLVSSAWAGGKTVK